MTRTLLAVAALASVVTGCTALPGWQAGQTGSQPVARDRDVAPLRALVVFARSPSEATWSAVPLAREVYLGLGNELLARRSARDLRDPDAWKLDEKLFRAGAGPFSALDLLARGDRPLRFSIGPHPHCVSPSVPPPSELATLRRISVQPRRTQSCLQWFTVDAFVTPNGEIRAVTLDFWEP